MLSSPCRGSRKPRMLHVNRATLVASGDTIRPTVLQIYPFPPLSARVLYMPPNHASTGHTLLVATASGSNNLADGARQTTPKGDAHSRHHKTNDGWNEATNILPRYDERTCLITTYCTCCFTLSGGGSRAVPWFQSTNIYLPTAVHRRVHQIHSYTTPYPLLLSTPQ